MRALTEEDAQPDKGKAPGEASSLLLLHLERPQQPSVCFSKSIALFKRVPPFQKPPLGCEERPGLGWILAQKSV